MEALPDLSIVLTFLRAGQGVSQAQLAELTGLSDKQVGDYERGRRPLKRPRLEFMVGRMGLPPERIDETLAILEANRASAQSLAGSAHSFAADRRRVEKVAVQFGRRTEAFVRALLAELTVEGEALYARQRAELSWRRLKRHSPDDRRLLVQEGSDYRSWALCERVAAESIELAANHPEEARGLAELAFRMAELATGEESWRQRLQGYALAHVANGRRVCSDLRGADEAIARAWKLWEAGEAGGPGLLNEAVLPWIEAALRRDQRRFPEAVKRIDEALRLDSGDLRAKILLSKSRILETLGDSEGSTAALEAAAPLVDGDREPRVAFGLRFNLLVDLCHLGRAEQALPRLAEVRLLAERLGELDLVRVIWLEGKVAAGLLRTAEARAAFDQVRREFTSPTLAYDCALVSLDLSLLLLEEGRSAEVQTIASEMVWIFSAHGVHREALAALAIFCQAAKQETATVKLARSVAHYLYRAQHDPELHFETDEGAGAG